MDEPPRLPDEAIKQLARDIVTNRVFAANSQPELIAFEAMLMLASIPESVITKIGLVYEYLDKAGPRSINGYPMFLSFYLLHIEDLPALMDHIERMEQALQ